MTAQPSVLLRQGCRSAAALGPCWLPAGPVCEEGAGEAPAGGTGRGDLPCLPRAHSPSPEPRPRSHMSARETRL